MRQDISHSTGSDLHVSPGLCATIKRKYRVTGQHCCLFFGLPATGLPLGVTRVTGLHGYHGACGMEVAERDRVSIPNATHRSLSTPLSREKDSDQRGGFGFFSLLKLFSIFTSLLKFAPWKTASIHPLAASHLPLGAHRPPQRPPLSALPSAPRPPRAAISARRRVPGGGATPRRGRG